MENELISIILGDSLDCYLKYSKDKSHLNQTHNSVHWVSVHVITWEEKEERRKEEAGK